MVRVAVVLWATDPTFLCVQRTHSCRMCPIICWDSIGHSVMVVCRAEETNQSEEVNKGILSKKSLRYWFLSDGQLLWYLGATQRWHKLVSIAMPRRERSNLVSGWTCQWFRHQRLACKSEFWEPKFLICLVRVLSSLASVWIFRWKKPIDGSHLNRMFTHRIPLITRGNRLEVKNKSP
jgi:hypothetical protein